MLKTKWGKGLCLIIAALLVEIFIFNIRSFERLGYSEAEIPLVLTLADSSSADGNEITLISQPGQYFPENLDTIGLQLSGLPGTSVKGRIHLQQEGLLSGVTTEFTWHATIPHSQTVAVYPSKPVTGIELTFESAAQLDVTAVLNAPVPFQINPVRLILILIGLFLLWGLRPGSSWYHHQLDFQQTNQRLIAAFIFLIYSVVLVFSVVSTYPDLRTAIQKGNLRDEEPIYKQHYQLLTEALLQRQTSLLKAPPERLAETDNPYDPSQRISQFPEYEWDMSYFDGRYYVYFGIVPALTFYFPYTLLLHRYPLNDFAVLFFAVIGAAGLVLVYTRLVRQWFEKIPAAVYFAGLVLLLNSSFLVWAVRRSFSYELAIVSAFAFSVCGLALVLAALQPGKTRLWLLSLGCLLMAAAVGCRPTSIIVSGLLLPLLVPAIIRRSSNSKWALDWKALSAVILPYLLVGVGLMAYNQVRFGSVTEFGRTYQLSTQESDVYVNGSVLSASVIGIINYVFGSGFTLISDFPFLKAAAPLKFNFGGIKEFEPIFAIAAVCPLIWLLPGMIFLRSGFHRKSAQFHWILAALVIAGLLLAAITGVYVGTIQRYTIDFAWILSLAGILTGLTLFEILRDHSLEKVFYAGIIPLLIVSTAFQLPLSLGEGYYGVSWLELMNPELFHQLTYFFSFWL